MTVEPSTNGTAPPAEHGPDFIRWAAEHPTCIFQPPSDLPAKDRPAALSVGDTIKAPDRDNFGRVTAIHGDYVTLHFTSPDGREATKDFLLSDLVPDPAKIVATPTMSNDEFMAADLEQRFLVEGILPMGQNCVIGGRSKTLKTSIMLDLAYSIATRSMFLRKFVVPEAVPVAVLSGESGAYVIRETASRIARNRGQLLSSAKNIRWGFDLPRLSREDHRRAVEKMIVEHGVKCVFIDPLYLSLLDAMQASSASNLYAMGAHLLPLSELAAKHKITLVILHHFRKGGSSGFAGEQFSPPELEELSLSGIGEWARSWVLLSRRESYEPGSGQHRLWLSAGGSAGHGGLYGVNINEGRIDDAGGRRWEVEVANPNDARSSAKAARDDANERDRRQRVLDALKMYPSGETARALREAAGMSQQKFGPVIAAMVAEGIAIAIDIKKHTRTEGGFCLSSDEQNSDGGTCRDMVGQDEIIPAESGGGTDRPFRGRSHHHHTSKSQHDDATTQTNNLSHQESLPFAGQQSTSDGDRLQTGEIF